MRHSDFWRLMDDEFGPGYARSVAADQVVSALGDLTPDAALASGASPREVWAAVCEAMSVPPDRHLGVDPADRRRR